MVALVLTMLLAAAAPDRADALAPAAEGKVQCYRPNTERKTCASTSGFRRLADGGIEVHTVALLASSPVALIDTTSRVTLKGGAVCSPFTAADIDNAAFTIDGQPATEEIAGKLKSALKTSMAKFLDHELCTAFVSDGAGLRAEASIDGQHNPAMDEPVIWVGPNEGYHVAP